VRRRAFLSACGACGALAATSFARAQEWAAPARFARPDLGSDEGGLWSMMDREETKLRRSPFAVRDAELQQYVHDIACRLAGDHCPDIRVQIVRTPLFNASMAPNGMMQVWTGLLLRMENEAQLAAVLGHEIGHYLERHSVERLRDIKQRLAFMQFLGAFGWVGAIGQIGMAVGGAAYSRDQERAADRIGITLMRSAGYDTGEAARVWSNLLLELKAREGGMQHNPLFASHPAPSERQDTLAELAKAAAGGATNAQQWVEKTRRFRHEWLLDEVKRGQHEESIALLTRLMAAQPNAEFAYARGEIYRLRGRSADVDAALADYETAAHFGGEPAETYRGLGLVYRSRNQAEQAKSSFERYIQLAPNAPDVMLIKSYMEEPLT
jgi:predicted Zn-dependent protease